MDPERNAWRKLSTQWLTIERHNRKRGSSLFCTQTPGLVTKLCGSHRAPGF